MTERQGPLEEYVDLRTPGEQNQYEQLKAQAERELYEDTISKQKLGEARDVLQERWSVPQSETNFSRSEGVYDYGNRDPRFLKAEAYMAVVESYGSLLETVKAREIINEAGEKIDPVLKVEGLLRLARVSGFSEILNEAEKERDKILDTALKGDFIHVQYGEAVLSLMPFKTEKEQIEVTKTLSDQGFEVSPVDSAQRFGNWQNFETTKLERRQIDMRNRNFQEQRLPEESDFKDVPDEKIAEGTSIYEYLRVWQLCREAVGSA